MSIKKNYLTTILFFLLMVLVIPFTLQNSYAESVNMAKPLKASESEIGEEIGDRNVYDLQDGGVYIRKYDETQIMVGRYGYEGEDYSSCDIFKNGQTIVVYSGIGDDASHGIIVCDNLGQVNIQFGAKGTLAYYSTEITTSDDECPFEIGKNSKVNVTFKDYVTLKSESANTIQAGKNSSLTIDNKRSDDSESDYFFKLVSENGKCIDAKGSLTLVGAALEASSQQDTAIRTTDKFILTNTIRSKIIANGDYAIECKEFELNDCVATYYFENNEWEGGKAAIKAESNATIKLAGTSEEAKEQCKKMNSYTYYECDDKTYVAKSFADNGALVDILFEDGVCAGKKFFVDFPDNGQGLIDS